MRRRKLFLVTGGAATLAVVGVFLYLMVTHERALRETAREGDWSYEISARVRGHGPFAKAIGRPSTVLAFRGRPLPAKIGVLLTYIRCPLGDCVNLGDVGWVLQNRMTEDAWRAQVIVLPEAVTAADIARGFYETSRAPAEGGFAVPACRQLRGTPPGWVYVWRDDYLSTRPHSKGWWADPAKLGEVPLPGRPAAVHDVYGAGSAGPEGRR